MKINDIRRRRFLQTSATGAGALAMLGFLEACKQRTFNKDAKVRQADDYQKALLPLIDGQGKYIRYPLIPTKGNDDPTLTAHVKNLLTVYSAVYKVMNSAIPKDQADKTGATSTPGQLAEHLPERVADGTWERFAWWSQAKIHLDSCPHNDENFLFWHRPYLFYFEKAIRKIATSIAEKSTSLPVAKEYYTNWTLPIFNWDPSEKAHPAFFDVSMFPEYPDNPDMGTGNRRLIDANSRPVRDRENFVDVRPETINSLLTIEEPEAFFGIEGFSSQLEGAPHGGIHVWVGGQMQAFFSPLDPIFWTHHGMIDFLFEEYMIRARNKGYGDAQIMVGGLPTKTHVGFFDVDTGKEASMSSVDLMKAEFVKTTYHGLSKPNGGGASLALNGASSGVAAKGTKVIIDSFKDGFLEMPNPEFPENGALMRMKLQVREDNETLSQALALLEKIAQDLRSPSSKFINSVQVRIENLSVALSEPENATLDVSVRRSAAEPFVETNYAKFNRTATGGKKVAGHEHHDQASGFMLDLVPAIRAKGGNVDFKELLTKEIFTIDFRLRQRAGVAGGSKRVETYKNAFKGSSSKVKVTIHVSQRPV